MSKSEKKYIRFYPVLKWTLVTVSLGFFAWRLYGIEGDYLKTLFGILRSHIFLFAFILLLMLCNSFLEGIKFRYLLNKQKEMSLFTAFYAVLGGITVSNFTPARTGDYIGRALLLKEIYPVKVILATITGNLAQVLLTYGLGILAFLYILGNYSESVLHNYTRQAIYVGILLFVFILILWKIPGIYRSIQSKLPKWISKGSNIISKYSRKTLLWVLVLSGLRYACFTFQFFLLLQIFSVQVLPFQLILLIPVAYMLQSLVPVPAISDIGVRVFFSELLFSSFMNSQEILLSVSSLWLINLILPGILGAFSLLYSLIYKP